MMGKVGSSTSIRDNELITSSLEKVKIHPLRMRLVEKSKVTKWAIVV